MAYSVLPSNKVSDTFLEPINATLAMNCMVENVDNVVNLDN